MTGKLSAFVRVEGFPHGHRCFAGRRAPEVGRDPCTPGTAPSREILILKPNQLPSHNLRVLGKTLWCQWERADYSAGCRVRLKRKEGSDDCKPLLLSHRDYTNYQSESFAEVEASFHATRSFFRAASKTLHHLWAMRCHHCGIYNCRVSM
jgi:hypothetical protein